MTDKQKYWIVSPRSEYAQVEGAEQRDVWTKVRGWSEAGEPGPADRVHLFHAEVGHGGPVAYEALPDGFAALGWSAGPPLEPVDITKDPALVDQRPAAEPAEGSAKPQTKPAPGGKPEEK